MNERKGKEIEQPKSGRCTTMPMLEEEVYTRTNTYVYKKK